MRMYIICISAVVLAAKLAFATVIRIPGDFDTIQLGINAGVDGDTILVHPGTYVENISFNMHTITLASLFLITDDTSFISSTVLDGYSSGPVISATDLSYSISRITGFTIQNGHYYSGGGIFLERASPEISHNIIKNNSCIYNGGGIYCGVYSESIIDDNIISENYAGNRGGGVYIIDGHPQLSNNRIYANTSGGNGGGLYIWDATGTDLTGNVISGNAAQGAGGGVSVHNTFPFTINRTIIAGNSASNFGGGISAWNSRAAIYNSTIYGNLAGTGGGVYGDTISSYTIANSIFWGDTASVEGNEFLITGEFNSIIYCDVRGGLGGEGNIDSDPLFVDPGNGDFHIQESSPCIDAGDPSSPYDPDGTIADMGVYFYHQGYFEILDQSQTGTQVGFWFDEAEIRWQQFYPNLDNISAVEIFIMKNGFPGNIYLQLSTDTGDILDELEINQDQVPSLDWMRSNFSRPIDLVPGQPYRIYVFSERPSPSPYERYTWRGNPDSDYPGRTDVYDSFPDFDYAFITYGFDFVAGTEQPDFTVLPEEYVLLQNYPNPFNAGTTISNSLPRDSEIKLSVYNLLGQHVETLLEGAQEAGEYAYTWKASHLSSGIYFARLETGERTENIKMVLLK